jgi:hypothetical protein
MEESFKDDTICPFCKSKNQCMAQVEEPCWCNNANVPKELLALVPKETINKSCVCLSCIKSFNENPLEFKKKYTAF